MQKIPIGFSASGQNIPDPEEKHELLKEVIPDDLIKYGFESEFMGASSGAYDIESA